MSDLDDEKDPELEAFWREMLASPAILLPNGEARWCGVGFKPMLGTFGEKYYEGEGPLL